MLRAPEEEFQEEDRDLEPVLSEAEASAAEEAPGTAVPDIAAADQISDLPDPVPLIVIPGVV